MSLAKKCDICGVLYEPYNTVPDVQNVNGIVPVNITCDQSYIRHGALDCCPRCMKVIRQTLEDLGGSKKETRGERWIISSTYRCCKNSLLEKYPFLDEFGIEEEYGVNRYGHPATKSYITVSSLEDLCAISKKADESNPVGFTGLLIDEIDGYMSVEIQEGE